MASATVTLKYGKSYTYSHGSNTYKFTEAPTRVTGRELVDKLKTISQLQVDVDVDAPVVPLKSAKPAGRPIKASTPPPPPVEEPEEEPADDEEPEATDEEPEEGSEPVDGEPETTDEEPADSTEAPTPKVNKGQFAKGGAKAGAKKGS